MLVLVSVPVIQRMLDVLYNGGAGVNRTNLATKCGLNYGTCIKYLELFSKLEWVLLSPSGRGSQVVLTERGLEYARIMLSDSDETLYSSNAEINNSLSWISLQEELSSQLIDMPFTGSTIDKKLDSCEKQRLGCVMIVDDERDVLMTYRLHLSEHGFEVLTFDDPSLATKAFRKEPKKFDIVLLDLRMAQMNGIQVFQKLKSVNPDIKIIFISGLDAAPELTSVLPGLQRTDIFSKPVDLDKLTEKLCTLVSH